MKEKNPFNFDVHTGNVGHSVVIGQVGAGMTVPAELVKLWSTGHPGGTVSIAQAGALDAPRKKRRGKPD
ncbi:hypothetical protein M3795_25100 [Ralstonia pickettii]|uniref:hypothetical protein n=1 Tax=Ralstonia pickettii TaxID=329 RepID=UPI0020418CA0|nr:hypothetical protein [Ralstonia pickettii]MCM3583751.1 hypothetical protein [Ralstonia pickettii]